MAESRQEFEGDWLHGVFGVFREEVISIAADFGTRVKGEIDTIADATGIQPPSATALLTSVAIESANMASSLLRRDDDTDDTDDTDDDATDED